jgi:hypothetical protein
MILAFEKKAAMDNSNSESAGMGRTDVEIPTSFTLGEGRGKMDCNG